MANEYDYYSDIKNVYNAKAAYALADTDEERKKQNEIAKAARRRLTAYGYEDIANQISENGATSVDTLKVLKAHTPQKTDYTESELTTQHNNQIIKKQNELWGLQTDDHKNNTASWDKYTDYIYNTNAFTTDEAKAILDKYSLAGLQGRDNEVASGSASNGGNIDSFAAANALRQQASLVNQGQMAVLTAHQQKLDNIKASLEGLGLYQKDSYNSMLNTINNQQTEAQRVFENNQSEQQRLFENEQTDKINNAAILSEQAAVTGYIPNEWIINSDSVYSQFLNADGTFKKEMENIDIQTLIDAAKAKGQTDVANKLAVVRAKKIYGNYSEFGKYQNEGDIAYMEREQTRPSVEFDKTDDTTRFITTENNATEKEIAEDANKTTLAITNSNNATEQAIADKTNATNLEIAKLKGSTDYDLDDVKKMLKDTKTPSQSLIDLYNSLSGDATTYTVDNPPPITGQNVTGVVDNGDGGEDETYAPFETWNTNGMVLQEVSVAKPKESDYVYMTSDARVDDYGKRAINSVYTAVANGVLDTDRDGKVTNYELADFLVLHSAENETDKAQLKKVFSYFKLNPKFLNVVEDVGKGDNLPGRDFKYGVTYKLN